MNLSGIQVGETVFVYDVANGVRSGRAGEILEVSKVTKKTVYATRYGRSLAFDIETGHQKQDGWCHLKAWRSKADYDEEVKRSKEWFYLRQLIGYAPPSHLSTADIVGVIELLRVKNKEEAK